MAPPTKPKPSLRFTSWPALSEQDQLLVPGVLHVPGELVERVVPLDVFPLGAAGLADLRVQRPALVHRQLKRGGALRAQRAAIDGAVRVAFDVHEGLAGVEATVAEDVGDHRAAHRAVRADRAYLRGAGDLEVANLCDRC